ncbi:ACP S-malonyltransferase [Alkaliphilus sp. MSJ-5]|uniref:Malonyl CoA-acyl carrier protein transacylase n=1 Tax=Alkaliphilus flagellatus TaxID=2841507 RepID=A0ABS6G7K6_9FIRM|nr:ACP S-malonyltransferase [Alkaliphilus flagellatus]MBU5677386.1 ACP S-malonyltransferase [Alkaliphilus flagellatus]
MGKIAFVFPGQGAQYVGMGKDFVENFPVAKSIFEEASDEVNIDMKKLCFEGPDDELMKTENTQPAILTTSIAMLKVLENEGLNCHMTAGLSLGEYTSLVKSNVFSFKDAVKLVKKRGKYMQEEVPMGIGTMAAILGLNRDQIQLCIEKARQYGIVEAANYNSPGQIVISGEIKAVEAAVKMAAELGAKKAVILPVSAPFHCSLLKGAGEKLQQDLELLKINDPEVPVITNVEASILSSKLKVIPSLVQQVSKSVLWEDSVSLMLDEGVDNFIEIGPGKALSSFIKRIAKTKEKKVNIYNVEDVNSFKQVLQVKLEV